MPLLRRLPVLAPPHQTRMPIHKRPNSAQPQTGPSRDCTKKLLELALPITASLGGEEFKTLKKSKAIPPCGLTVMATFFCFGKVECRCKIVFLYVL